MFDVSSFDVSSFDVSTFGCPPLLAGSNILFRLLLRHGVHDGHRHYISHRLLVIDSRLIYFMNNTVGKLTPS